VSSEIARGLDIFELQPSAYISQNEIDAAKTVHFDYLNTQGQPKLVWPPSFALARAYVDQLERSKGLSGERIAAIRQSLASAESASGAQRSAALNQLATQLDADAAVNVTPNNNSATFTMTRSRDAARVGLLAAAVRDLAR
jgi:hypothetical protein